MSMWSLADKTAEYVTGKAAGEVFSCRRDRNYLRWMYDFVCGGVDLGRNGSGQ